MSHLHLDLEVPEALSSKLEGVLGGRTIGEFALGAIFDRVDAEARGREDDPGAARLKEEARERLSPEFRGKSILEVLGVIGSKVKANGPLTDEEMLERAQRHVVANHEDDELL